MFILVELQDYVRIAPHDMGRPRLDVLTEELNAKFANKVCESVE